MGFFEDAHDTARRFGKYITECEHMYSARATGGKRISNAGH